GLGRNGSVDIGAFEFRPLVVNTDSNGSFGKLDLGAAVRLANVQTGADTITFDGSVFNTPRTITLTSGPLTLTDTATTTIVGPGANLLSVSGNHASRVFLITAGAHAAISGMTITGGRAVSGAGVLNNGTLSLTNCIVSGNAVQNDVVPFSKGGGVYN